jgi:F0F1-type ATP synthase assembly protein I
MSPSSDQPEGNRKQTAYNITLAVVAGQVGCLTLVIVLLALFGGLWLDSQFDTRPMFTLGLMIISIPITLVAMIGVVRAATSRLQSSSVQNSLSDQKEETISEQHS